MSKTLEQKYKKLTDIEHVLLRPGRYLGSVKPHTALSWVVENDKMVRKEVTWNPALLKMFDEVISNSVDESKRKGSKLDTIKVTIDQETGEISVWDNGGIPVEIHKEHDQYIPEMIFGELRSGSNFDDTEDSFGTGQNGEGSSLVNIFSLKFTVETCDGKKRFKQTFSENLHKRTKPAIKEPNQPHTKITFTPDYERLETRLDEGNFLKLVKRVYDISGCNPELKITLNGNRIQIRSFKDYIKLYTDEFVFEENDNWKVGIAATNDGFQHVTFVNTTETTIGGTHILYIANQITDSLRTYFKKKHKVDIKPSEIRNHFTLFIDAKIVNPRYSSQTKEDLITEPKDYKTEIKISDKFVTKIAKSPIIQDVLDWIAAKEKAAEMAALRKANKENSKANPRHIAKLSDASERDDRSKCILFLTEGDSASKAIQSARDAKYMASFPLKGKPINVNGVDLKKLIANEEFSNLQTIIGLQVGEEIKDPKQLRYGKIAFMTDADVDGSHIRGLLINMLYAFWPELFKMNMIYMFKTPLIKVFEGKKIHEFFDETEYHEWKEKNPNAKFKMKYFKGLGTSKTDDFKGYLANMNKHLIPLTIEDRDDVNSIHLAFDKTRADDRKEWLALADAFELAGEE